MFAQAKPNPRAGRRLGSRQAVVAGVFVAIVVCHLPSFLRPLLDDDEAQYAAIGELVRTGARLYADGGVDMKTPGIYWMYAGVSAVTGRRYPMGAVHAVTLAVVLATAAVLGRMGARIGSWRAGALAALFYGVFSAAYPKMLAANTEIFMMLPISAAVTLLLAARDDERWLARTLSAGALLAAGVVFKQIAFVTALLVPVAAWGKRRWLGRCAVAGLGFAAAIAIALAAVWRWGSLEGLWHWAIFKVATAYRGHAWNGAVLRAFAVGFLPPIGASLVIWIAAAAAALRLREPRAPDRILWTWAALSFASACAGGHFFPHYYVQVLAPTAVIAALEIDRRWGSKAVRTWVLAGTAAPALVCLAIAVVLEPVTESFFALRPTYDVLTKWVRDHTRPDERIFVWGMFPPMYVEAERLPASRFVGFMRGTERNRGAPPEAGWDVGPEVWPALEEDFRAHPPALIADTSTANLMDFGAYPLERFPSLATLVARGYMATDVVGGVTLYRRRDPLSGGMGETR